MEQQAQQQQPGDGTNQYKQSLQTYCSDRRQLIAPVSLILALIFVISSICVEWASAYGSSFYLFSLSNYYYGKTTYEWCEYESDPICKKFLAAGPLMVSALIFILASIFLIVILAALMSSSSSNGYFNRISKCVPTLASFLAAIMLISGWGLCFSIDTNGGSFSSGPYLALIATVFTAIAAVVTYMHPMVASEQPKDAAQYQSYQENSQAIPAAPQQQYYQQQPSGVQNEVYAQVIQAAPPQQQYYYQQPGVQQQVYNAQPVEKNHGTMGQPNVIIQTYPTNGQAMLVPEQQYYYHQQEAEIQKQV